MSQARQLRRITSCLTTWGKMTSPAATEWRRGPPSRSTRPRRTGATSPSAPLAAVAGSPPNLLLNDRFSWLFFWSILDFILWVFRPLTEIVEKMSGSESDPPLPSDEEDSDDPPIPSGSYNLQLPVRDLFWLIKLTNGGPMTGNYKLIV